MIKAINGFDGKYEFLSNFHLEWVEWGDIMYPTNEHAFQAAKTLLISQRLEIAELATPGQAKRAGRKVKLRTDWEQIKTIIMGEVVLNKFQQNPELKKLLLETGDAELIEKNCWHDNIWGNCDCGREKCRVVGENRLGIILMLVREIFRNENNS